ncbi:MAG: phytoene desaturase [Planctomycetota bacterium]|nr:phytoene desaturase [Planctomycetota bacterium]
MSSIQLVPEHSDAAFPQTPKAASGNFESKRQKAAVIGSGFGGLAVAIRLQSMGFETTCFEMRDKPGGRAYVYEDDGFTFDAGPTVITAPHCIDELFELAGRRREDYVKLLPVTPFYRLKWKDGFEFDYVGNEKELINQIRTFNPADVDGYKRFADYTRRVFQKGYMELGAEPFLRFIDMVKVTPQLMRLRADRSVYKTVSRFIKDERLRQAFSFHPLLVGGNPMETSSIYTLIHWIEREWGVFFPEGGTGALVRGLVKLFEELGGRLKLDSPVQSIQLTTSQARKGNGPCHQVKAQGHEPENFDVVVSNADVHHTYSRLYADNPIAQKRSRRLGKMQWSMSLFVMYFGTNRRFHNLAHHTILFGPRFKGLLKDIFYGSQLPKDFSLYLHAPTATDSSLAPDGCESFYVLSPVPHLGQAPIDWETVQQRYGDAILQSLEEYIPGIQKSIVTRRHFTPREFQSELNAHHGSAFSVSPKLTQSAYFRPHNKDGGIPGLYIVGAGTHPGAGVPGVINTAKATANVIANDYGVFA